MMIIIIIIIVIIIIISPRLISILHFSKGEKKQDLKEKVAFCRE
jgi:hypothetical protein